MRIQLLLVTVLTSLLMACPNSTAQPTPTPDPKPNPKPEP